jgi:hypothetical protein
MGGKFEWHLGLERQEKHGWVKRSPVFGSSAAVVGLSFRRSSAQNLHPPGRWLGHGYKRIASEGFARLECFESAWPCLDSGAEFFASSQARSHQTQVDVPAQSHKAEEDNAAFNWDEGKRYDRGNGPQLVAVEYDSDGLVLHILPDGCRSLAFENAHDDDEGSCIHDCPQGNAVDEPFDGGVAQIQLPASLLASLFVRILLIADVGVAILISIVIVAFGERN